MSEKHTMITLGTTLILLVGSLGCVLSGASGDDSGNDDFANAESITPGTCSGKVSRPNDPIDYYKVDVELGKYLIFNFSASENWEVVVTIYYYVNYEYTPKATSGSMKLAPVSWEHRISRVLGYIDPSFYISIESRSGTTSYSIRIEKYDFPEGSLDNKTVVPDKTYDGVFALFTQYNSFGSDLKDAQIIRGTVSVDDTSSATGIWMRLFQSYGHDRDQLESVNITPGKSHTIEFSTSMNTSGRYYFYLHGTNCNYTFSLSVVSQNDAGSGKDAPDVFNETLTDTVLLPGTGTYSGSAQNDDTTDWYSFNVTRGQIITFELTNGEIGYGNMTLKLYNRQKALVNTTRPLAPWGSESGRRITSSLGAGLWYINISGNNKYIFNLTLADQADGGAEGDAGDTLETARQAVPQVSYNGLLGNDDTLDCYAFRALADKTYKVNAVLTSGDGVMNATLYDSNMLPVGKSEDASLGSPVAVEFIPSSEGLAYLAVASKGAEYSFDIVPPSDADLPSVAITSPANGSILPDPTFDLSGTASDSSGLLRVEVSLSGIVWSAAEGTTSWTFSDLSVGEGITSIWARATDILGNTNITWIVVAYFPGGAKDTEKPRLNITSPANGAMLGSATLDLSGTASDDVEVFKVEVSLSGIAWWLAEGTADWAYRGLRVGEGITTVYVKATDFAGKSDTASVQVGYRAGGGGDTRSPQIAIASPANGSMLGTAAFDVSGTASDDFAVVIVEVSLNGIAWLPASGTANWTYAGLTVGEGISTVWARATDFSGNTEIAWISVGLRAGGGNDTQRPQIAITSPANGSLVGGRTFDVAGTASDDFSVVRVEVSLNGIAWLIANGTGPWNYSGLAVGEGVSTIWARAIDFSGNTETSWILVGYRAAGTGDGRKPQVTITSPANGSVAAAAAVNLTGTASDDFAVYKVEVSLSGIEWWLAAGTGTWSLSRLTLGEGGNTIYVRATDFAGNANTTSVFVTYIPGGDTIKPTITLTSLKDKAKVSKDKLALLSGGATDNVAVKKVTLKVNDADVPVTFGSGVWTAVNVTLKEGKNTVVVTATDSSGNVQAATFTITYEKPKSQPGFEAGLLIAAAIAGIVLLGRRRR